MKLFQLGTAVFWAIGHLYLSGCATTCDTIKVTRQQLADNRIKVVFACSDKTIEATVKQTPECLDACWKPAK